MICSFRQVSLTVVEAVTSQPQLVLLALHRPSASVEYQYPPVLRGMFSAQHFHGGPFSEQPEQKLYRSRVAQPEKSSFTHSCLRQSKHCVVFEFTAPQFFLRAVVHLADGTVGAKCC